MLMNAVEFAAIRLNLMKKNFVERSHMPSRTFMEFGNFAFH